MFPECVHLIFRFILVIIIISTAGQVNSAGKGGVFPFYLKGIIMDNYHTTEELPETDPSSGNSCYVLPVF